MDLRCGYGIIIRSNDATTRSPGSVRKRALRFLGLTTTLLFAAVGSAATFSVNTTTEVSDINPGDGDCWDGSWVQNGMFLVHGCPLKAAIQETNALPGPDRIVFSSRLPVDGAGTIVITNSVNTFIISDTLTIDGTTAPTYDVGNPEATPVVVIEYGGSSPFFNRGLALTESADGSTILGLSIVGFVGSLSMGIHVSGADNVLIQGNHIGVAAGSIVNGNERGILIDASSVGTTIGQTFDPILGFEGAGNLISGNSAGIEIQGSQVFVAGNRIGTDPTGMSSVLSGVSTGNGAGIVVSTNSADTIQIGRVENLAGSADPVASGNVISGNAGGLLILDIGAPTNVSVRANLIGVNATGTDALPNAPYSGIDLRAPNVVIGEPGVGRNVISGNAPSGIEIQSDPASYPDGNTIMGNFIGLDASGTLAIGNAEHGIHQIDGRATVIAHNQIGANFDGIRLSGDDNEIYANQIGTNANGDDLGNTQTGIYVEGARNQIGRPGEGNVVAFGRIGIQTAGGSSLATIQSNSVGADPFARDLGQSEVGLRLAGNGHTVGGDLPGLANVVGHSAGHGIAVEIDAYLNTILGNYVGTNADGDDLGNGANGIDVHAATETTIGAAASLSPNSIEAHANRIAHNGLHGVRIWDEKAQRNTIRGNTFESNAGIAIDLGTDGATPNDATDADFDANRLQNSPVVDAGLTVLDTNSGQLDVAYLVDSDPAFAYYPLVVDFYLRGDDGEEPAQWICSDTYLLSDAGLTRQASLTPALPLDGSESIMAIATDDRGNSSEVGNTVPVPEPGLAAGLLAGMGMLASIPRRR